MQEPFADRIAWQWRGARLCPPTTPACLAGQLTVQVTRGIDRFRARPDGQHKQFGSVLDLG